MNKLVYAGLSGLLKNRMFKILNLVSFIILSFLMIFVFVDSKLNPVTGSMHLELFLRLYPAASGFSAAILTGFFIGTEFSERTVNSKLISGYTRTQIYLSQLIICVTAAVMMQAFFLLIFFAYHIPMFGISALPMKEIFMDQLKYLCVSTGSTALMLMLTVTAGNKSTALFGTTALIFAVIFAYLILQTPFAAEKCPEIVQKLIKLSSVGRTFELITENKTELKVHLTADAVITAVTTACGILIFRRKNLR